MVRKNTPPVYGLSDGPYVNNENTMIVAVQLKRSSGFVGPAEQLLGGSLPKSCSSFVILLMADMFRREVAKNNTIKIYMLLS